MMLELLYGLFCDCKRDCLFSFLAIFLCLCVICLYGEEIRNISGGCMGIFYPNWSTCSNCSGFVI